MSDPRGALAEALQGILNPEQMEHLINEVLAATKKVRCEFHCKHCGRRQIQMADMSDAKTVALVLPDLLNQAYGRPVEASVMAEPITFIRLTDMKDLPKLDPRPRKPRKAQAG